MTQAGASIPLDTPQKPPLQCQTPPTSNLIKWGTPTLIPNTDETFPSAICSLLTPEVLKCAHPLTAKSCMLRLL